MVTAVSNSRVYPKLSTARFQTRAFGDSFIPNSTSVSMAYLPLQFGKNLDHVKAYHKSDQLGDQYQRYNPANTNLPPALFHTIASSDAHTTQALLAKQLEMYIAGRGHKALGIPWITYRKPIVETEYTVFDVETTGLDQNARIIQLAATPVRQDHRVDHSRDFDQLIHPGTVEGTTRPFRIAPEATAIHGISQEQLEGKPTINEILAALRPDTQDGLLGRKRLLVAYNAKFDVGRMNEAIRLYNRGKIKSAGQIPEIPLELVLDPFILIQRLHPFNSQKKTLGTVYKILMGTELENKHDAQADVDATIDVLKYTLKYLQKHAIPREWCLIAEGLLRKEFPDDWEQHERVEKASLIAAYVARHRTFFEKRYPEYRAQPIRAIDILRFQWGALATHDGMESHYPVFDITLDKFGLDKSKYWDGTDRLDLELVREVRQEREKENLQYLLGLFQKDFPQPVLQALAKDLRVTLRADLAEDPMKANVFEQEIRNEILKSIGKRLAYKILKRERPANQELEVDNEKLLEEIRKTTVDLVSELLERKCQKYGGHRSQALLQYAPQLAEQVNQQARIVLERLGNRYLYSYVDVDVNKLAAPSHQVDESSDVLVDSAVLRAYAYAAQKAKLGHKLLYQNPDPALRGRYHLQTEEENPKPANTVQKGILIQQPWLDKILDGQKKWEIRGTNVHTRGWIALAESGTKLEERGIRFIKGVAYLDDVKGPLSNKQIYDNIRLHKIPKAFLDFYNGVRYKKPYAWVLKNVVRLETPVAIPVKSGQITWFNIPSQVQQALAKQFSVPQKIKKTPES